LKKNIIIPFIIISLANIVFVQNKNTCISNAETQLNFNYNRTSLDGPKEKVYKNLFITLFIPYVNQAISDYYDEYFSPVPIEDPWNYKFIDIEKNPEKNYSYIVILEVMPYIGPHITVGTDRITFLIELDKVKVEKFEHLKSHVIPLHYQNYIKKEIPTSVQ